MRYTAGAVISSRFSTALRGLAVDGERRLYAAGDASLHVVTADGVLERQLKTSAPPWCVAVDRRGRVFAGEEGQIEVFDPSGRLLATWRHGQRLGRVTAIGFVGDDVLAGDALGRAIRRFDADGAFLNDIGAANRMQGFLIPNGIVQFGVDEATGTIHAANPGKHRVEQYTRNGELLGHIGRFDGNDPAGFGGCCNPTNVTVSGSRVFVTEKAGPRAKAYELDGRLAAVIADTPFDPNCKNMAIAVDGGGRVFVGDTVRRQVFTFQPDAERAS